MKLLNFKSLGLQWLESQTSLFENREMRLMLATYSTIYKDLCHYDVDLYNSVTAKSINAHLKFHEHGNLCILESYHHGVIELKLGHL